MFWMDLIKCWRHGFKRYFDIWWHWYVAINLLCSANDDWLRTDNVQKTAHHFDGFRYSTFCEVSENTTVIMGRKSTLLVQLCFPTPSKCTVPEPIEMMDSFFCTLSVRSQSLLLSGLTLPNWLSFWWPLFAGFGPTLMLPCTAWVEYIGRLMLIVFYNPF